jgi:hypothetical protein
VRDFAAAVGDDSWALLEGRPKHGLPVLAVVRQPLKPARWPRFDQQVTLRLPYETANDAGLPTDSSLQFLRAFEDDLVKLLGEDATVVGHESHAGHRTLHIRADSQTQAAEQVRNAALGWPEGRATVTADLDPGWKAVAHLRA